MFLFFHCSGSLRPALAGKRQRTQRSSVWPGCGALGEGCLADCKEVGCAHVPSRVPKSLPKKKKNTDADPELR